MPSICTMYKDFLRSQSLQYRSSQVETARFGLAVGRLLVPFTCELSDQSIFRLTVNNPYELLIVRYPSSRAELTSQLLAELTHRAINAGPLVYYSWNISSLEAKVRVEPLHGFEQLYEECFISDLITRTFESYSNHYYANPKLREFDLATAYEEWARNMMSDDRSRTFVVKSKADNRYVGFAIAHVDLESQTAEIMLNGIEPESQRRGLYSALLQNAANQLSRSDGIRTLYISSQLTNKAVISAWQTVGMQYQFTVETFHVMR